MSATDDVVDHIRGSLLDLRRRLDGEVVADIARAVCRGAEQALREMGDDADAAQLVSSDAAGDVFSGRTH